MQGCTRYAVEVDGTESIAEVATLKQLAPAVVLLSIKDGVSRVHASRRVFETLQRESIPLPVVHHIRFPAGTLRDDIVLNTGAWVGGLLVDGLGDGVLIEAEGEDTDFLRTTSFGLLQGSRMRNTKTEYVSCPSCGRTLFNLQASARLIEGGSGGMQTMPGSLVWQCAF